MSYQGPLPPPSILEAYDRIVPNGAERIFSVFEKQAEHRQALETTVIGTNARLQIWGFFSSLFLCVATIGGGMWLAYLGKNLVGLGAIVAALASLVGVFIYGKKAQAAERDKKTKSMHAD